MLNEVFFESYHDKYSIELQAAGIISMANY